MLGLRSFHAEVVKVLDKLDSILCAILYFEHAYRGCNIVKSWSPFVRQVSDQSGNSFLVDFI